MEAKGIPVVFRVPLPQEKQELGSRGGGVCGISVLSHAALQVGRGLIIDSSHAMKKQMLHTAPHGSADASLFHQRRECDSVCVCEREREREKGRGPTLQRQAGLGPPSPASPSSSLAEALAERN